MGTTTTTSLLKPIKSYLLNDVNNFEIEKYNRLLKRYNDFINSDKNSHNNNKKNKKKSSSSKIDEICNEIKKQQEQQEQDDSNNNDILLLETRQWDYKKT